MADLTRRLESRPWHLRMSRPSVSRAKRVWAAIRSDHGFAFAWPWLMGSVNAKLMKNMLFTVGLSLSHAETSGVWNTCRHSTALCRRYCVSGYGHGSRPDVVRARKARTILLGEDPEVFGILLLHQLRLVTLRHDHVLSRLNVFSDIRWEHVYPQLFDMPRVSYYDYTKWPHRDIPHNYRVTYSMTEAWTSDRLIDTLERGDSVAAIIPIAKGDPMPDSYEIGGGTWPMVDGDLSDNRFNDPRPCVVGLRPKQMSTNEWTEVAVRYQKKRGS